MLGGGVEEETKANMSSHRKYWERDGDSVRLWRKVNSLSSSKNSDTLHLTVGYQYCRIQLTLSKISILSDTINSEIYILSDTINSKISILSDTINSRISIL